MSNIDNAEPKKSGLDGFFGISEKGSTIKTEILAGLTTFLAMVYILNVNPLVLVGLNEYTHLWNSVFVATALGAVVGCLLMSLLAKMPLAQAPGMGINSMVGGWIGFSASQLSFQNAMFLIFISGLLFIILTVVPCGRNKETGKLVSLRELIFDSIPAGVRTAIPVGIGMFITYLGMSNAGMIVFDGGLSFIDLDVTTWGEVQNGAMVCLFGLVLIAILAHFNITGSVIIGILGAAILGIPLGVTNVSALADPEGWKFWNHISGFFSTETGTFGAAFTAEAVTFPANSIWSCIIMVIVFCMLDMFDTMGTVLGCATKAGLLDETGKPLNYNKCMISDSVATCVGAVFGTTTVTTFIESGTGVAAGGKTGLTSLTTAILFFLSLFILPVFQFIPSAASACALIYVGVLMMSSVKNIDFSDAKVAVPAFLTIIMMLMAASITEGIGFGFIFYVIISFVVYIVDIIKYAVAKNKATEGVVVEKPKFPITVVMAIVTAFFLIYFLVPSPFAGV